MMIHNSFECRRFDMGEDKVSVEIPKWLYEKIAERIEGTSFSNVSDYITNRLQSEFSEERVYTEEEERKIKERLRRLGYIP